MPSSVSTTIPTTEQRHQELIETLLPDTDRLLSIQQELKKQLEQSLHAGKATNATPLQSLPSIRVVDSCITRVPLQRPSGSFYAINVEKLGVEAARVSFPAGEDDSLSPIVTSAFEPFATPKHERVHLETSQLTATVFAETVVRAVQTLFRKLGDGVKKPVSFVLVSSYLLDHQGPRVEFLHLDEFIHEKTVDPILGIDLLYLCNMHLTSCGLDATISAAVSQNTAVVLAASCSLPRSAPRCRVAVCLGERIGVAYVQTGASDLGFRGEVLDVDLAHFNGNYTDQTSFCLTFGLPYTIPDFEVDAVKNPPEAVLKRSYENMTATSYLPEVCRWLVIRTFEREAPEPVWAQDSLSYAACEAILADSAENHVTKKILKETWDWELPPEHVAFVKELVVAVFDRSAALVAAGLAAVAKRTGRLQPALGGVTLALSGKLTTNKRYQEMLRVHLDRLFHRDTSELIVFYEVSDGAVKGAAVLNSILS